MTRSVFSMVLAGAFLCLSRNAKAVEPPTPGEILAAWGRRDAPVRVEWQQTVDGGVDRFSRFPAAGFRPAAEPAVPDRLEVDGDRLRYAGRRRIRGEHGYRTDDVSAVTFTLSQMFPERQLDVFEKALENRFEDSDWREPAAQSFVRVFEGSAVRDFWKPDGSAYPRATIHQRPEPGSPAWALLSLDEPEHELETLDFCAALMAMVPGHRFFGIHEDNCRTSLTPVLVAGTTCWEMRETAVSESDTSRTFWVDPECGFVVRRFLGQSGEQVTQFDIGHRLTDSLGWVPEEWTVMRREMTQEPIQHFVRSRVTEVAAAEALSEKTLAVAYPVGTWVVDEPDAEQYLVQAGGTKRVITRDEFRWLPTYDELLATHSGTVGILLESKIKRRQFWQQARWPLMIGIAAFVAAAIYKLWNRPGHRQISEAAKPFSA